jgi:hypothetical protein
MWPIPYFLLRFLLCSFGAVLAGSLAGALFDYALPALAGAVIGFFAVYYLWVGLVPIRCPTCGGLMIESGERGSRRVNFTCNSCGLMR